MRRYQGIIVMVLLIGWVATAGGIVTGASDNRSSFEGTCSDPDIHCLNESDLNESATNTSAGTLQEAVRKAVIYAVLEPLQELTNELTGLLTEILVSVPDVTREEVLELHQQVFQMTIPLATAAIVWIGILTYFGRGGGVRAIGYVLGGLGIGGVAPWLLRYPIELSRLTTKALAPTNPGFWTLSRFTLELALVALLDTFFLLGIGVLFVVRNFFLLYGVAMAPLLAVLMATPYLRQYSTLLVNIWVSCLLVGPFTAAAFALLLSILEANGELPHWLLSLGGLGVLFGIPLLLFGAATVMVGPVTRVVGRGSSIAGRYMMTKFQDSFDDHPTEGRSERDNTPWRGD